MNNTKHYKKVCEEEGCDQILSIDIHIFIMTRDSNKGDKPFKDKESNMWVLGEKEKTICEECFSWYTPQNHNGWYDDEGQIKEAIKTLRTNTRNEMIHRKSLGY
jgi:hypothetical protein